MDKVADPIDGRPEKIDNLILNLPHRLPGPSSIADTGLSEDFLTELAVKHIFYLGNFRMRDLCEKMLLPAWIIEPLIQKLRDEKFCEVKGGTGFQSASYQFSVTADGRRRALEYLEKCLYTGPAPVSLEQYSRVVAGQSVSGISVNEKDIIAAFSEYVVGKRIVDQLGAAVNSGRSIFLYGPAGNGKTVLAEALGGVLRDTVYIPYSIAVDNSVIRVFDPITHVPACDDGPDYDRRWVRCRRPVVLTGGELTLEMLDLEYNPVYRFYEAPFQLKANGGLLIIDDFGRQLVRPRDLLNRWVVPLERKADFLTLHTGQKFEVPFDELVVFSTNLAP
ncbi:MAG TPA: ATPase, partial [Nitrospirota bacterium]